MYTILLNEDNELITSVKERIMQRSKLVDNLHFLVEPDYKGIDMSDFTVTMEYILPVSREYKIENLFKSDVLYKGMLEYKLPFDTCLTKEAGKIEIQLTFTKAELDEDANSKQMVRKTSPVTITIVPISAWSDIIADDALTALDQRLLMIDARINEANEFNQYLDDYKADNIVFNSETSTLQLSANGKLIGDSVKVNSNVVISIEVSETGDMIVNYSDGSYKNIGKVGSGSCAGIYIPSYSPDGILTFTLSDKVGEPTYSWDVDKTNDWNPINGTEQDSSYAWNTL